MFYKPFQGANHNIKFWNVIFFSEKFMFLKLYQTTYSLTSVRIQGTDRVFITRHHFTHTLLQSFINIKTIQCLKEKGKHSRNTDAVAVKAYNTALPFLSAISKRVKGLLSRWDLRSTALSTIYTCIIIVFRHLESLTPPWSPDATPVLGVTFRVNRCVLWRHTTHHPLVESGHHELQHLGLRVRQVHTLLGVICQCTIQRYFYVL